MEIDVRKGFEAITIQFSSSLPHSIPFEERENAVFVYPQIFINSDDGAESDPFSFIGRLF